MVTTALIALMFFGLVIIPCLIALYVRAHSQRI